MRITVGYVSSEQFEKLDRFVKDDPINRVKVNRLAGNGDSDEKGEKEIRLVTISDFGKDERPGTGHRNLLTVTILTKDVITHDIPAPDTEKGYKRCYIPVPRAVVDFVFDILDVAPVGIDNISIVEDAEIERERARVFEAMIESFETATNP